jgi:eukaryotic-like serine/threonine-protein kinase
MTEDLRRGSRLGKYELLLRIGRGGMATVWVAREHTESRETDRLVAVKAILADLAGDPEFVKMFLDEGRLVQAVRHANVVDVYEVGEDQGVMYLAMEWVEGDSLHSIIAEAGKRRPIPPEMGVRIIADAAAGLHAAHELKDDKGNLLGVVHRDVSPHNILIGTDGAIKLVDFGVAKAMGRLSDATSAGQLKGKFGYMSPEQAMAKPVDRRSDVFALGIVLFELTTGRRLFRGEHDAETLHLVVSGQIPKPSKIDEKYPPKLEAIVMRALERDIDKRYQTAAEFQQELETYLKQERVVVARAGVAALLKKVMGTRIEQRRRAVRASLRALDGEQSSASGLISSDSVFTPTGKNGLGSSSSVSSITGLSTPGISHSGLSAPSAPTGSYTGVSQQNSSGVSQAPGSAGRGSIFGYVVGILGLAVALVVVLSVAFVRRRTTTKIVDVAAPGVASAVVLSAPPDSAAPAGGNQGPAVDVSKLKELEGGAGTPRRSSYSFRRAPVRRAPDTVKRAPSAPPPANPGVDGLRKNPYGH